jgi:hypothetical protein
MTNPTGYTCRSCGEFHEGLPLSYRTQAPAYWSDSLDGQPKCVLEADLCIVRGEHYFIQGNIEIPIIDDDAGAMFSWGVWVSLSEKNFQRSLALWEREGRESEPPYFGWLSTDLALYPGGTLGLKTNVHTQPVGRKPLIELEPTDHPLAVEQRHGITWVRVQEIAEAMLHQDAD